MYLQEILMYLSWPVTLIVSYQLVKVALKVFEKRQESIDNK